MEVVEFSKCLKKKVLLFVSRRGIYRCEFAWNLIRVGATCRPSHYLRVRMKYYVDNASKEQTLWVGTGHSRSGYPGAFAGEWYGKWARVGDTHIRGSDRDTRSDPDWLGCNALFFFNLLRSAPTYLCNNCVAFRSILKNTALRSENALSAFKSNSSPIRTGDFIRSEPIRCFDPIWTIAAVRSRL